MIYRNLHTVAALCTALIGYSNAASYSSEQYASGEVHAHIMGIKMVRSKLLSRRSYIILTPSQAQWDAEMAAGQMNSSQWPELGYTKCIDGFAAAIPGGMYMARCIVRKLLMM